MSSPRRRERGSVLVVAVAMSIVIVATAWAALRVQSAQEESARVRARDASARAVAEAGLELAIARLDADPAWRGARGRAFAGGTLDVEVAPVAGAAGRWRIRSVGRLPQADGLSVAACCVATVEGRRGEAWRRLCWSWSADVR